MFSKFISLIEYIWEILRFVFLCESRRDLSKIHDEHSRKLPYTHDGVCAQRRTLCWTFSGFSSSLNTGRWRGHGGAIYVLQVRAKGDERKASKRGETRRTCTCGRARYYALLVCLAGKKHEAQAAIDTFLHRDDRLDEIPLSLTDSYARKRFESAMGPFYR